MEVLNWIDKKLYDIKGSLVFGGYFDTVLLEKGAKVYYLLNPHRGIDLILREDMSIKAIHFYSGKQKGTNQFTDELPFGLDFSLLKSDTRKILGEPAMSGGGGYSALYGQVPLWDKYLYDCFSLHLQFSEDQKTLDLITIGSFQN